MNGARGIRRLAPLLGLVAILGMFLVAVLSFAPAALAHVLSNQWFSHGPANEIVYAVAVDPANTNNVYAGTTNGVYKSTDGGESWNPSNTGIPTNPLANNDIVTVFALAIDPQNSNIIYAGVDQPGNSSPATQLFKSTNGGTNWASTGLPLVQSGVMAIALDPTIVGNPESQRSLYAGATGASGNASIGVYKSTDGGTSFVQINTGLTDRDIRSIAIVRSSPNIVYAGTGFGGVFKSTNGGGAWSAARTGLPLLPPPGGFYAVRALLLHPTDANTVYAATAGGGVYKSTDGGASWLGQNSGLTNTQGTSLAINPTTPDTLYAGTAGGGVFKSTNGAQSWSAFNNGLTNTNIQSLAIDPLTPTTLYAGASGDSVYRINQAAAASTITLSPSSLPPGTVGVAYTPNPIGPTITASGGAAPYTFTVTSGGLPPGLALAPGGLIDGVPSSSGSFHFTVTATDALGSKGSQAYTITVNSAPIVISPSTLPDGTVGVFYSQQLSAVGGAPPYTWTADTALSLGLSLSSGGLVSGTPTQRGPSSFTVRVTDSVGQSATQLYAPSMAAPASPLIATTVLPDGTVGVPYNQTLLATGGTPPLMWSVLLGSLPSGLGLVPSTGQISGTPTQVQTATFTIQVTDYWAATATLQYTVAIIGPTITLIPSSLPNGTVDVAYSQTITASGGTPPHTFAVTSGQLPPGLATSPGSLVISGTPTQSGSFSFTVTATDAFRSAGSQAYTITVNAPAPPAFLFDKPLPDPNACLCLPPFMVQDPATSHSWWVRAIGGRDLEIQGFAVAVNSEETGNVTFDVFNPDGSFLASTGPVTHPTGGETLAPAITVPAGSVVSGGLYRIRVIVNNPQPPPPPPGGVARHYRFVVKGGSQIGANSPLQAQAEHDTALWQVNVASGEALDILVQGGPEAPAPAATTIQLISPTSVVHTATLGVPFHLGSAQAGIWHVLVDQSNAGTNAGHYVLSKTTGTDRGVYVNWMTSGFGDLTVNLTFNGGPNTIPITVRITDLTTGQVTDVPGVVASYMAVKQHVGAYKVEVVGGIAESHRPSPVIISLTCDETEILALNLVNTAPIADNDSYSTPEDIALVVAPPGVLDGDTDVEGDTFTAVLVTAPALGQGSVTLNSNGSFTFTPAANFNGTATFTYKAQDSFGAQSSAATVSVTVTPVNDLPTANAGPDQTVNEGVSVSLSGSGSDIDGDTLSFTWVQTAGPAVTLTGANTATPSFTAPQVTADLTLTFQITVSDPFGATATDSVVVTVRDVPTQFQAARTIGYWKNHQTQIAAMLTQGSIDLGGTTVTTVNQAVSVLSNASAQDARNSLRAQLLATILNLRNGANPFATGPDIRPTVFDAKAFLASHPSAVNGGHPDRTTAIALKDRLDAYNNSGE